MSGLKGNQKKGSDGKFVQNAPNKPLRSLKNASQKTRETIRADWADEASAKLSTPPRCIACGQFSDDKHTCPPEALREYAIAEDTATAALHAERFLHVVRLEGEEDSLRRMNGEEQIYMGRSRVWTTAMGETIASLRVKIQEANDNSAYGINGAKYTTGVRQAEAALDQYEARKALLAAVNEKISEANDRYNQFKWTRAFLVVNNNGHVHSSMDCSTCYETTQFNWLPSYSGSNMDQIVEDAGERACTVCYPNAPVEVLNRPTKIFSEDEREAMAAREKRKIEQEEKRAAKALKAATKDGSELVVVTERGTRADYRTGEEKPYVNKEYFKTERAAYTWAVDAMWYAEWRAEMNPDRGGLSEEQADAIDTIVRSLAEKHGVEESSIREELAKKLAAKKKRDR